MKDLDKPTVGPVHLQLFRPSVIRGPCLNLQLPTIQTLTNDVQMLILCLSYFINTVKCVNTWGISFHN